MNKYAARVKKLISKTHYFVSHKNLCLTRDYYNDLFDMCEKSEAFEEKFKEHRLLWEEYGATKDHAILEKINSMYANEPGLVFKSLAECKAEECISHPNGKWIAKNGSSDVLGEIERAKAYFAAKKSSK